AVHERGEPDLRLLVDIQRERADSACGEMEVEDATPPLRHRFRRASCSSAREHQTHDREHHKDCSPHQAPPRINCFLSQQHKYTFGQLSTTPASKPVRSW